MVICAVLLAVRPRHASAMGVSRQIHQDLAVGDRAGKRESKAATDPDRPQHFELFTVRFWKHEISVTDPYIRGQNIVDFAPNEFVHGRLVMKAPGEPRKMTPGH